MLPKNERFLTELIEAGTITNVMASILRAIASKVLKYPNELIWKYNHLRLLMSPIFHRFMIWISKFSTTVKAS